MVSIIRDTRGRITGVRAMTPEGLPGKLIEQSWRKDVTVVGYVSWLVLRE